jgi:6-phosphogluconolactonase
VTDITFPRSETSRREFLATSAQGILGIASLGRRGDARADEELLYIGAYTDEKRAEGIYLVGFDTRTGALRQVGAVNAGANPSFLAIHPNGRFLYAVNEVEERGGKKTGGVSAFAIDGATGSLTKLCEQASEGGAPCYVSVDRRGKTVLVANYSGGSVAMLPIQGDGALGAATTIDRHQGKIPGPNAERQEAPHAHCIVTDPSNRFALSADLGLDRVFVYRLGDDAATWAVTDSAEARLRPGSGPRHIAFHPTMPLVYVANELDSTVTTVRFDRGNGGLSPIDTHSTLPAGWHGTSYAADIHVAPLGNTLYVSNRGHNSIAVFSVAGDGSLALEQTIPTEGDWPRNFSLDPTGRWLLVGNQNSGSVVALSRPEEWPLDSTGHASSCRAPCAFGSAHVGVTT